MRAAAQKPLVTVAVCGLVVAAGAALAAGAPTPLGLPSLEAPADSALTLERVALGRKLFMDRRLSHNNTLSCSMCHLPEQGFTSNELRTPIGVEGRTVRRNAPTLYNVGYLRHLFHDGRETTLEHQAWSPLLARNEMANPSIGYVVDKLKSLPEYADLFERAFGQGPSMVTVGQALASYQRSLVSGNSRFDRWYYGKQADALTPDERAGFEVFRGKGGCAACHTVGENFALFTDDSFHNTGVGYSRSMGTREAQRVTVAPGVVLEVSPTELAAFEPPQGDVGRFEVTFDPRDRWSYRTPTLRNVALTGPYMHDGSIDTLEAVVEFYDRGGVDNPDRDPLVRPLGLADAEKRALAAFLRSLTGDNVETLLKEARAEKGNLPLPSVRGSRPEGTQ